MVVMSVMLKDWVAYFASTFKREEGQGFTEYALIFALVVLVAAAVLSPLGTEIANIFKAVIDQMSAYS